MHDEKELTTDHPDSALGRVVAEYSGGIQQLIFGLFIALLLIVVGLMSLMMSLSIPKVLGGPVWEVVVIGVISLLAGIAAGITAFFVWKRKVIVYAEGISDIWLNKQRTIRWDSVSEFRLKLEPIKGNNSSMLVMFGVIGFIIWMLIPKPKPAGLFLVSKDNVKIELPASFPNFESLGADVKYQIFNRQLAPAIESIRSGKLLDFSGYLLDSKAIIKGNSRIEWSDINAMWREDNKLEIYGKDTKRVWAKVPYEDIPNGQLLAEIMLKYYEQSRKTNYQ